MPFILTSMGGLCQEGHDFLRLCKKRNKSATLRLLDVLVTQHARWTARRIRRALFGQSLIDFSGSSWCSVKIRESASQPEIVNRRKKQVSRMSQEFSLVPGMSQYRDSQDVDMDVGTAAEPADSESFSTPAVNFAELPQSFNWVEESTHDHGIFSPTAT